MRRRRKFKGLWLPNLGTVDAEGDNIAITAGRELELGVGTFTTEPVVGVIPLTFDQPQESNVIQDNVPLVYQIGNGYALRRIVGKADADFRTAHVPTTAEVEGATGVGTAVPAALVTVAMFIARAEDENIAPNLPIGGLSGESLIDNYNPDSPECIREPWIWRRKWILGNPLVRAKLEQTIGTLTTPIDTNALASFYPSCTSDYGSVLDGPHIDARTRRRVTSDDRLWLAMAVQAYPRRSAGYSTAFQVNLHFDYRLFGALRRDRNRGNF